MAICFKCGAIIHDSEALTHLCRTQDLPEKGIMHLNGKKIDIKTSLEVL